MRLIGEPIKRFYASALQVDMPADNSVLLFLAVMLVSVLGVSVLGAASLAIIPLIVIIILSVKNRIFLLYILFASLPISMSFFSGVHRLYSYSVVIIFIALWFCRKMLEDDSKVQYSSFLIKFICFYFFVIVLSTVNNGITSIEMLSVIRYSIFFPLVLVIYDIYEPKHTIPLMIAIMIPSLISAYYLFSVYLSTNGIIALLQLFRMKPGGIFSNANSFGGQLLFVVPFWFAMMIWGGNKYIKVLSGLIGFILATAMFLTNSRAAMVGLALAIIFYFVIAKKIRYLLSIVIVIVVIFVSSPFLRDMTSIGLRVDRGGSNRELIWENSFDIIKNNFFFGVGSGNFGSEYRQYLITSFEKDFIDIVPHAHNEVIQSIAVLGVLGLIIIVTMFYVPLRKGFILLKKPLTANDRAVVYGLMGILFANMGRGLFDATIIIRDGGLYPTILYWLTMIMIIKMLKIYENMSNEHIPANSIL